ncbi:hypothetical protein GP486_004176 [Trichoglossum hirsutum]|uniref:Uncharacterized protein n=1 Tax=Trichoglossum hirsutum TaxID=265104 RepID=A0A9P8LBB4_9PEZI|nr:hypothetical protein GP486_004176 [Trichoglossum hirsutum]
MPSLCSDLYFSATSCFNATSPSDCFCRKLLVTSCSRICQHDEEAAAYLRWIKAACGGKQQNPNATAATGAFSPNWVDWNAFQATAYQNLFPWKWYIHYTPPNGTRTAPPPTCPSNLSKLGAFVLVNAVILLVTAILGRATVVQAVTFGKLGTPGSPFWPFTALCTTGLSILANFANAYIVHSTPGYGHTSTTELALLWLSRPRISWVAVVLVMIERERGMYFSVGASALLSEVILQTLGAVYLGRTVHFAQVYKYLRIGHVDGVVIPRGKWAYVMFIGAALWITAIGFVFFLIIWTFFGLGRIARDLWGFLARRAGASGSDAWETTKAVAGVAKLGWVVWKRSMLERLGVTQQIMLGLAERLPGVREAVVLLVRYRHMVRGAPGHLPGQPAIGGGQQQLPIDAAPHQELIHVPQLQLAPPQVPPLPLAAPTSYLDWLYSMGLSSEALKNMLICFQWMVFPFLGQWLFWAGFVNFAEDL